MSIQSSLITELANESASSKRLITSVPSEHWGWKPHEKSMELGALSKHIVELYGWIPTILGNSTFNFATDYQPINANTTEELLVVLDELVKRAKQAIEASDEEQWKMSWQFKNGEHVIAEMTKIAAMRYIINNHMYHHRGQVTVYLRLLDIPVPGMYGPSADDK